MGAPKTRWESIAFALLAAAAVWIRLNFYEPLDRSVSNYDTERYAIIGPILSSTFLTSEWTAFPGLIYKLAEPGAGYQITNLASPGDFLHPMLAHQPGFESIVQITSLLTISAWVLLAWVIWRRIENATLRFIAATLVLFFGVCPQIVEWDYVLASEPLSMSLSVILLAASIEMTAAIKNSRQGAQLYLLFGAWLVVVFALTFTRDTNSILLPWLSLGGLLLLLFHGPGPEKRTLLVFAIVVLLTLFVASSLLARNSERWVVPYTNNLIGRILPNSEYMGFFEDRGLEIEGELSTEIGGNLMELSLLQNKTLMEWIRRDGISTYGQFIALNPAWTLATIFDGALISFEESSQPYFRANDEITPDWLVYIGDLLHPKNLDVVLLLVVEFSIALMLFKRGIYMEPSVLFTTVMFFGAALTLLSVSILGDAGGVARHSVTAVMLLKLFVWILPLVILDGLGKVTSQRNHER